MKSVMSKDNNRSFFLISIVFLAAAVVFRFAFLDNKPIHFDESINMWFVRKIWENGYFTYDPTNYHGPLYFYLVHFAQLFTGDDFISTRVVASLFSFFTLVALWFGPKEQRNALRWAALFLLLSPAMGFFGRSGIHESAFVFFQIIAILGFHELVVKNYKKFWWYFGGGILGMMAIKETFVIWGLALVPTLCISYLLYGRDTSLKTSYQKLKQSLRQENVLFPGIVSLFIFIGVFTGFGGNPKGIVDFFVALMPWLKTGVGGAGHQKEFLFWTKLIAEFDFGILLGFSLGLFYLRKNPWFVFYGIFAIGVWLIYSLIPYKTPWCLISLLWPFAIAAGFAVEELWSRAGRRVKLGVATCLLVAFSLQSLTMYRLIFRDPIDMEHPYVYVNSTYQMKEFIAKVQALVKENPLLREEKVQIGIQESWPFPVVFSKIYNLSYQKYTVEVMVGAMIYLVDSGDRLSFEQKLPNTADYGRFLLTTRQSRSPTWVYVKKSLFAGIFSWALADLKDPL